VESNEIDLSDFQDVDDGINVPLDNDAGQPAEANDAPQQQGEGGFPLLLKHGCPLFY
jgi:DNA replication licensing factor MCM6